MRSINGFNNSSLQGSSDSILANKIGAGVDIAKTAMSNDVHFQTSVGGTSYSLPQQVYNFDGGLNQFDCVVFKYVDPENPSADPEYRLKCVNGLTTFENYNVDEQGFIKDEQFVWNHRLNKWNVYPTGTLFDDPNDNGDIFLAGTYIKLTKNKNYKVFLYKINPTITEWPESVSVQIAIIEEGSPADSNVKSKFDGGGAMQTYLVSDSETVNDVVTADPDTGRIGKFNPADLNEFVTFNADLLEVIKDTTYPSGMETWLDGKIPAFAKPSTDPTDITGVDGMSLNYVPFGCGFNDFNHIGIADLVTGWVDYSNGEDDCGNGVQNNIVVSYPVGELFGYTANPLVSGLIDPSNFKISSPDFPAEQPVSFNEGEIDIIPDWLENITSTTLEVPTGKPVGNVGFKYFDCSRKEIAYIEWVAADPAHPEAEGKFDVYQINNGPIVFNYKPMLLYTKKVTTQADAHWGTDNDSWVSPDIVEINPYWGSYTDDLTSSKHRDNSSQKGGYLPWLPTRSSG